MQRPPEDGSDLERLKAEVRDLERRIACLEGQRNVAEPGLAEAATVQAAGPAQTPAFAMADLAPVVARAIFGLAGAYVFRALAETSVVPRLAVVVVAIAYACLWLWIASRERVSGKTASFVYAATAALILSPLLWEATVRFGLLPNLVTAALLAGFPVLGGLLGVAGWPAVFASSGTAIALMVRTGDVLPFVIAVLAIAVFFEIIDNPSLRVLAAVAADAAVLLLVWIAVHPTDSYLPVQSLTVTVCACALPLICLIGILIRRRVTASELWLPGIALAITVYGSPARVSGLFLLAACAACIWLASRIPVLEFCALPAGLAAAWLLAPPWAAACLWCLAAVVVSGWASSRNKRALAFHAVVLFAASTGLLAQSMPDLPVALLAVCAALAWWLSDLFIWPRLFFASLAVLGAGVILSDLSGADPHLLPTFQTLYLCATALGASYASRFLFRADYRPELGWLGYGLLGAAALKLLVIDFRESDPGMLAVALVCFGVALIAAPRLRLRV